MPPKKRIIKVVSKKQAIKNNAKNTYFLNLIANHFKENQNFNVDEYIKNIHNNNKFNLESFDICKVLPNSRLIAEENDYKIIYRGKECEINCIRLYKYEDQYIICKFSTCSDEDDVLSIEHNFDDLINFYRACIFVYPECDFDHNMFLNKVTKLDVLISFFYNMNPISGLVDFQKYVENKYGNYVSKKI